MGLMKNIIKFCLFVCLLLSSPFSISEWLDGKTIVNGEWGEGENQFGILYQETSDELPGSYDISESGNLVLADKINGRFKVFDSTNKLIAIVTPPTENQYFGIMKPTFVGENISLISKKYFFFDLDGELISEVESPKKVRQKIDIDNVLYLYQTKPFNRWVSYSNAGELLQTFSEKPLFLGRYSSDFFFYNNQKRYRATIQYDDYTWTVDGGRYDCFQRDQAGNLYCVNEAGVTRYNRCGKPVAELKLPESVTTVTKLNEADLEGLWTVHSEYMDPKIDIHGNLYATHRSPESYSLVKWTWQDSENDRNDGPDAPINLTASFSAGDAVKLEWEGSLQDPGCVTGYRIWRSEAKESQGAEVFTIENGHRQAFDINVENGKTYYYRLQALSEVADSVLSDPAKIETPE